MRDSFAQTTTSMPPFDEETGDLNVMIETPKGSRNKYAWDEKLGLLKLKGVFTVGHSFPYDFGFIPNTRGGDGDPIDVLVLMDEPAFVGCYLTARLIGVIEAEQTERDGRVERNDRLIAVASESKNQSHIRSLDDLNDKFVREIEHFFVSYNEVKDKVFRPIGRNGAEMARELVEKQTLGD
jgi:inorganic pyrophosphatase